MEWYWWIVIGWFGLGVLFYLAVIEGFFGFLCAEYFRRKSIEAKWFPFVIIGSGLLELGFIKYLGWRYQKRLDEEKFNKVLKILEEEGAMINKGKNITVIEKKE